MVIVAGYQDLDSARGDFETLADRAKGKHIALRGAVLVGKDHEGNPMNCGGPKPKATRCCRCWAGSR